MSIEIIPAETAWQQLDNNWHHHARWPTRQSAERLYPVASPHAGATFKINPEDKIFCIGSCFAREIESTLRALDFNVLSTGFALPTSKHRKTGDDSIFNKYNVATIYNELQWALNPETPYQHDQVLIATADQQLRDYHLAGPTYSDEPEAAKEFREAFNQAFSVIKEANIVIITLGLSEVWFDKHTGLYLNRQASKDIIQHYPDRFELHVFDYRQTSDFLEAIYALLQTHLSTGFRLLITVSPVPLWATFRNQDILLANTYSKAVLRTAVEEFLVGKSNVNYFPSYESVMLSNPTIVWQKKDFRHVNKPFVEYMMASVMEEFVEPTAATREAKLMAKAIMLYQGNFITEAREALTPLVNNGALLSNPKVKLLWQALQLQSKSQSKNWLLGTLINLRNQNKANVWKSARNWYRQRGQKKSIKSLYMGYLDLWNGKELSGWACGPKKSMPCKINVLVDDVVVANIVADLPRKDVAEMYGKRYLKSGFYLNLQSINLNGQTLRVVYADTHEDLNHSPISLK